MKSIYEMSIFDVAKVISGGAAGLEECKRNEIAKGKDVMFLVAAAQDLESAIESIKKYIKENQEPLLDSPEKEAV